MKSDIQIEHLGWHGRPQGARAITQRLMALLYPFFTTLGLLALVELLVVWLDIPRWMMPQPTTVLRSIVTSWDGLLPHVWLTLQETLIGFALTVMIAIPLGIILDASWRLELAAYPLLVLSQVVPIIAVAPLLIIWFGFGLLPKVLTVVVISFFPLLIHTMVGLKAIQRTEIYLARSMKAGRVALLTRFKVPGAMPNIFAGLKVASTYALIGAVIGEFVASSAGLGWVVMRAHGRLDMVDLFTAATYLAMIGFVIFAAVDLLERKSIPWHRLSKQ